VLKATAAAPVVACCGTAANDSLLPCQQEKPVVVWAVRCFLLATIGCGLCPSFLPIFQSKSGSLLSSGQSQLVVWQLVIIISEDPSSAQKMEAACPTEALIEIQEIAWHNFSEDSIFMSSQGESKEPSFSPASLHGVGFAAQIPVFVSPRDSYVSHQVTLPHTEFPAA
jgi:hypothetical protein